VVAGAIGGLLLTVVVLVIILACRRAAAAAAGGPPDLSAWPRSQQDRLSTSTTNTTSSNQEPDDLDGSDSLPEYHANYVKQATTTTTTGGGSSSHHSGSLQQQQPDLLHSNIIYGASVNTYTGKIYSGSMMDDYANYNPPAHAAYNSNGRIGSGYSHSGSQNNLLESTGGNSSSNKVLLYSSPNYSSPYLQSASPISQLSNSTAGGTSAPHAQLHTAAASPHGHRHLQGWDLAYSGPAYSSGRFNAVAHSLQSTEVDLNESSVGTHV
jgi:hypothetical protein